MSELFQYPQYIGIKRMRRRHTCRRCSHKVCGSCSKKRRYDAKTNDMVRVCDRCLLSEHCIVMTHRLRNLKLKHNRRNRGTYIVKVKEDSKEYNEGLINKCKVIEINEQNVESLNAQLIADKLNTIRIPFSLTLDYKEAEVKHEKLMPILRIASKPPSNADDEKEGTGEENRKQENGQIFPNLNGCSPDSAMNGMNGMPGLMNAHQNPNDPYYQPSAYYDRVPVIVAGPSQRDLMYHGDRQFESYQVE